MVLLGIAAANRDPKHFPEPDRFDIGRSPNRHLGFGHGVHFCLGANLARAEAVAAVRAVVERLPEFEGISAESKWKPNPLLRGLERLELSWS
jgi:cytochrome P450 PksS